MPGTSKSGGKRAGAGRKAGSAWASKRPPAQRQLARTSRSRILEERDPLAELVRLGFEAEEESERIKALAASLPYVYPRLSMAVIADATPKNDEERVAFERLAEDLLSRINRRFPPQPQQTADAIEVKAEANHERVG